MRNPSLQKGVLITWLLVVPIVLCFYLGLFATMQWWYPDGLSPQLFWQHMIHFSVVYACWLVVFFVHGLFDLDMFRRPALVYAHLAIAVVINALIAIAYFYFQPALIITPRRFLLVHLVITTFAIAVWYGLVQYFLPRLSKRLVYAHPLLPDTAGLAQLLEQYAFMGMQFAGTAALANLPLTAHRSTEAVLILPENIATLPDAIRELYSLRSQPVTLLTYPDFYEHLTRRVHTHTLTELWFLESVRYHERRGYRIVKRGFDIAIGFFGTLLFIVTYPLIALLIKLDSRGPVFFKQRRVGLHGKPFWLYKYRTMSGAVTNTWTQDRDPRVTRVGLLLRKLRFDELPQAVNILEGDMSVVGPRPEQEHIVEELGTAIPYYHERHVVKPGLTGWGQLHVYAASQEESRRKLEYDLYYIKHRSLLFDLEVVLKTMYHIFSFRGK